MLRVFLRGRENVPKRVLVHYAALNLALLPRSKFGMRSPLYAYQNWGIIQQTSQRPSAFAGA